MTDNIKCPFCQQELCQDYTGVMYCCNEDCEQSADWYGSPILWQALAQVKQDLKTATKALEEISSHYQDEMGKPTFVDWYLSAKKMCDCADKALETIGKHNDRYVKKITKF